jgi:hypothetical protein
MIALYLVDQFIPELVPTFFNKIMIWFNVKIMIWFDLKITISFGVNMTISFNTNSLTNLLTSILLFPPTFHFRIHNFTGLNIQPITIVQIILYQTVPFQIDVVDFAQKGYRLILSREDLWLVIQSVQRIVYVTRLPTLLSKFLFVWLLFVFVGLLIVLYLLLSLCWDWTFVQLSFAIIVVNKVCLPLTILIRHIINSKHRAYRIVLHPLNLLVLSPISSPELLHSLLQLLLLLCNVHSQQLASHVPSPYLLDLYRASSLQLFSFKLRSTTI